MPLSKREQISTMLNTDKGLRPRIYKDSCSSERRAQGPQWTNGQMIRTVDRRGGNPKANKQKKRSSKSLGITQRKTRTRHHFTSAGLGNLAKRLSQVSVCAWAAGTPMTAGDGGVGAAAMPGRPGGPSGSALQDPARGPRGRRQVWPCAGPCLGTPPLRGERALRVQQVHTLQGCAGDGNPRPGECTVAPRGWSRSRSRREQHETQATCTRECHSCK